MTDLAKIKFSSSDETHTAKHVPSIKATGVRFIRFVTSPTAQILGTLVREYSSTCKRMKSKDNIDFITWHHWIALYYKNRSTVKPSKIG